MPTENSNKYVPATSIGRREVVFLFNSCFRRVGEMPFSVFKKIAWPAVHVSLYGKVLSVPPSQGMNGVNTLAGCDWSPVYVSR